MDSGEFWLYDSLTRIILPNSFLRASMHSFQETSGDAQGHVKPEVSLSQSTMTSYLGIERREALSFMAKRLVESRLQSPVRVFGMMLSTLQDLDTGDTTVRWRRGYSESDQLEEAEGGDILALSAFYLSSLSSAIGRRDLIKQMWSSRANIFVRKTFLCLHLSTSHCST